VSGCGFQKLLSGSLPVSRPASPTMQSFSRIVDALRKRRGRSGAEVVFDRTTKRSASSDGASGPGPVGRRQKSRGKRRKTSPAPTLRLVQTLFQPDVRPSGGAVSDTISPNPANDNLERRRRVRVVESRGVWRRCAIFHNGLFRLAMWNATGPHPGRARAFRSVRCRRNPSMPSRIGFKVFSPRGQIEGRIALFLGMDLRRSPRTSWSPSSPEVFAGEG